MTTTTGRCLCGGVTYSFSGAPSSVYYCHCDSCRRNCSAPVTAFVQVPRENFAFTGPSPTIYESSPGVRRMFCGTCGSPVAYDADWDKTDIHFYLAALDDPEAFTPAKHVLTSEQLSWFETSDHLPRYAAGSTNAEPIRSKPRKNRETGDNST